jgi:hypothetical protein
VANKVSFLNPQASERASEPYTNKVVFNFNTLYENNIVTNVKITEVVWADVKITEVVWADVKITEVVWADVNSTLPLK